MKKKLIIDCDIPFIRGVFEPFFNVEYHKGVNIGSNELKSASAAIIRTRTKCNEQLLSGSSIEAIATATIGVDHIDQEYCRENNIKVYSSAGCNARAVAQWVFSSIKLLQERKKISNNITLGIIGVGNVGSQVAQMAEELGVKVLLCDPPKVQKENLTGFMNLNELLAKSNIITLHVDLNNTTQNMVDANFLSKMQNSACLLNAARGEVINEQQLLTNSENIVLALDVWRNEPNINLELLKCCDIATPHIAGYSKRGKAKGSALAVQQIAKHFGVESLMDFDPSLGMEMESAYGCDVGFYDGLLRRDSSLFEHYRVVR